MLTQMAPIESKSNALALEGIRQLAELADFVPASEDESTALLKALALFPPRLPEQDAIESPPVASDVETPQQLHAYLLKLIQFLEASPLARAFPQVASAIAVVAAHCNTEKNLEALEPALIRLEGLLRCLFLHYGLSNFSIQVGLIEAEGALQGEPSKAFELTTKALTTVLEAVESARKGDFGPASQVRQKLFTLAQELAQITGADDVSWE